MVEDLLCKVPAHVKIVIRNRKEAKEKVMGNVEGYKVLRGRVEFDPSPF
jgi:hypothetical protein